MPAVEVDGRSYFEAGLVLEAVMDIWARPALAFRRAVEVAHDQWIESHRDLYPDGCPGHCVIHRTLATGSTRGWAS
jgi:hypothetical protein